MSDIAGFFIGQVELLLAVICLFMVFRIGRVGMSYLIVVTLFIFNNLFDQLAIIQMVDIQATKVEKRVLWYSIFALSSSAAVVSLYLWHRSVSAPFSGVAKVFIWLKYFSILLQMTRCSERLFFDTQYFNNIYIVGIPTANYLMLAALAIGLYRVHRRSKDFGERISWNF